ncbi:MAG: flagellin [Phycisphaeraceae bacterium]|nr:flagellin [Phycisphaeraceae bacterium]
MVTPINNSGALALQHGLGRNIQRFEQSAQRLSTGMQINRGADSPAGLISSEQLRSVLASLDAETRVLQRQDHVASTADAALSEVSNVLVDTKALQVQLGDGTLSASERDAIQMQIDANVQSVDRMAASAGFNGVSLFSGEVSLSYGGDTLDLPRVDSVTIGETEIDGEAYTLADVASGGSLAGNPAGSDLVIGAAIDNIATLRGTIGAYQANAIEPAINSTRVAIENTAEAESMIRDTDFAAEVAELNRNAFLVETNLAVYGAVNTSGARVLDLLA